MQYTQFILWILALGYGATALFILMASTVKPFGKRSLFALLWLPLLLVFMFTAGKK